MEDTVIEALEAKVAKLTEALGKSIEAGQLMLEAVRRLHAIVEAHLEDNEH